MARRSAFSTVATLAIVYELAAYVYNGVRANQVLSGTTALPGPLPLDGLGALLGYGPFVTSLQVSGYSLRSH
jgi:hypothetical protein